MAVRDDWIIYAIFGVFVCLLLWRVATQWKVKSTEAENLRVSVVIFGVVALVLVVWQCVRQASPIAAHSQDKTITVFAAASNESTRFNLLGNVLVLIAGKDSKIDHVDIEPGFDLAKLANDGRIATGDVQEVPVGLYAKASLEKLGVWPSVESKMAMTVNVRAALAYVVRGEAPLSIVYATDWQSPHPEPVGAKTSRIDVSFWHEADIPARSINVRFRGESGHRGHQLRGVLALVALRKPPSEVMRSEKVPRGGYSIDPRHGCPRASANGGFCRRIDAGPVSWRRRQSIADQGNNGAVARAALVVATKENAETFTDPCAHFQGRIGTRSLEAGHHRPFPDPQDLPDLSLVGRSWAEVA
jgi:hypothetical protein